MAIEDDIRSLDARMDKLARAVEKSATAQIESAQWCSDLISDVAVLMADVRELRREVAIVARAQSVVVAASEVSASYPIAAGYHDGQIAAMASRGCMGHETWLLKPTKEEAIAAWNRRAERTCRNVCEWNIDAFHFTCSECGAEIGGDDWGDSPVFVGDYHEQLSYCPNCGARVIEEES